LNKRDVDCLTTGALANSERIVGEMGVELIEEVRTNPHRFTFGRVIHTFHHAVPPGVVSGGVVRWDGRLRREWR
jgi:hypothetical protein